LTLVMREAPVPTSFYLVELKLLTHKSAGKLLRARNDRATRPCKTNSPPTGRSQRGSRVLDVNVRPYKFWHNSSAMFLYQQEQDCQSCAATQALPYNCPPLSVQAQNLLFQRPPPSAVEH